MRTIVLSVLALAIFSVNLVLAADEPADPSKEQLPLPKKRMRNSGPNIKRLPILRQSGHSIFS